MSKRHSDAIAIAQGAVNISGMAHSLVAAIFDGSFPVNPIHELIVQAEAERAAIVAEVDAIAGGF